MIASIILFLNLGTPELMLIMLAALLLFGGKKLPELARGLGKGIREFKDASDGVKREIHRNINSVNDDMDVTYSTPSQLPASDETSIAIDTETPQPQSSIELNTTPESQKS